MYDKTWRATPHDILKKLRNYVSLRLIRMIEKNQKITREHFRMCLTNKGNSVEVTKVTKNFQACKKVFLYH